MLAMMLVAGCATKPEPPIVSKVGWTLTSTDFEAGSEIPSRFSKKGGNVSPALSWSTVPPGTQSVALVVDDPDAPGLAPFVHWLVADLPPNSPVSPGQAQGVVGKNSADEASYFGPQPPSGTHHYHFKAYALDTKLDLATGFSRAELDSAMKGHVLDQTELVALFTAR